MTNNKRNLFFLHHNLLKIVSLAFLCLSCFTTALMAKDQEEDIAYQLAVLYTKQQNPEKVFLSEKIKPSKNIVAEFQWIMGGLKNRCLNPESVIAATIFGAWQRLKNRGEKISLLEVARKTSQVARNRNIFGVEKVNFRMTTNYWLKMHYPSLFNKGN